MSSPRSYTVVLSAAAKRAIERDLCESVAEAVVGFLYGPLAADSHRVGKPLRFELEGYWSARRGHYRVTYTISDTEVLVWVVRISPRRRLRLTLLSSAAATTLRIGRGPRQAPRSPRRDSTGRSPRHSPDGRSTC